MKAGAVRGTDLTLVWWVRTAAAAAAVLALASWSVVALAHVNDTYNDDHTTGVWLALAKYVNEGVLYPRLYDGASFGGTRYMPLQFVLHAGLARVTGEYLVSGKLFAYASAAALFAVAFSVYRRLSGSTLLALGLVAAVLSTGAGWLAATTVRGDALPAAFQLAAIAAVTRRGRFTAPVAGALCALAFASKLSAVWGAVAIVIWLAIHDRRRLAIF